MAGGGQDELRCWDAIERLEEDVRKHGAIHPTFPELVGAWRATVGRLLTCGVPVVEWRAGRLQAVLEGRVPLATMYPPARPDLPLAPFEVDGVDVEITIHRREPGPPRRLSVRRGTVLAYANFVEVWVTDPRHSLAEADRSLAGLEDHVESFVTWYIVRFELVPRRWIGLVPLRDALEVESQAPPPGRRALGPSDRVVFRFTGHRVRSLVERIENRMQRGQVGFSYGCVTLMRLGVPARTSGRAS